MKCHKCNRSIPGTFPYCDYCGVAVEKTPLSPLAMIRRVQKSKRAKLIAGIVVLLAIITAGSIMATQSIISSKRPTSIEERANAVANKPSPASDKQVLIFEDDFNDVNSGWSTGSYPSGITAYENGEFSVEVNKADWWLGDSNGKSIGDQGDFTVEVNARKISGGNGAACIIVFRLQTEGYNYYQFRLSDRGEFMIQKRFNGQYSYLKEYSSQPDWISSSYINKQSDTNRMKITCKGSQIDVYANGHKLATVTDTSLATGRIELAVLGSPYLGAHYHFDNFILYSDKATYPVAQSILISAPSLSTSLASGMAGTRFVIDGTGFTPRTATTYSVIRGFDKKVISEGRVFADSVGNIRWNFNTTGYVLDSYSFSTEDIASRKPLNIEFTVTNLQNPFLDNFSDPNSGWTIVSNESGTMAYEDGQYSLQVAKEKWMIWGANQWIGRRDDFTVEVDASRIMRGNQQVYGIVFRQQDNNNYYYFAIDTTTKTYWVVKKLNNTWLNLQGWTYSNHIQDYPNSNRLKVVCRGTQIEVSINDQRLTTVSDNSFSTGFIGLAAEGLNSHVHFDNFRFNANNK